MSNPALVFLKNCFLSLVLGFSLLSIPLLLRPGTAQKEEPPRTAEDQAPDISEEPRVDVASIIKELEQALPSRKANSTELAYTPEPEKSSAAPRFAPSQVQEPQEPEAASRAVSTRAGLPDEFSGRLHKAVLEDLYAARPLLALPASVAAAPRQEAGDVAVEEVAEEALAAETPAIPERHPLRQALYQDPPVAQEALAREPEFGSARVEQQPMAGARLATSNGAVSSLADLWQAGKPIDRRPQADLQNTSLVYPAPRPVTRNTVVPAAVSANPAPPANANLAVQASQVPKAPRVRWEPASCEDGQQFWNKYK